MKGELFQPHFHFWTVIVYDESNTYTDIGFTLPTTPDLLTVGRLAGQPDHGQSTTCPSAQELQKARHVMQQMQQKQCAWILPAVLREYSG